MPSVGTTILTSRPTHATSFHSQHHAARSAGRLAQWGAALRRRGAGLAVLAVCASLAAPADAARATKPAKPGASAAAAPAPDSAAAFAQLSTNSMASRTVSLAQLGLGQTVLGGTAPSRREFYLPVPAGIAISNATLQMDATYLRGDGGRTSVLLSLDGTPVMARGFLLQTQGDAGAGIGVDGTARASGFLRVGLGWTSVINDNICADQTANGNVLEVAPSSHLSYRFDSNAVTDLRTAWSAMPQVPVVMVAANTLDAQAYDSAWRSVALLQRDGKAPLLQSLPKVGDTVNLSGVAVPAGLRGLPAFAALAGSGSHVLANPAEVAAWIGLAPRPGFAPDLLVMNDALRTALNTAIAALRTEVLSAAPASAASFDAWRTRFMDPLTAPLAAGEVRLAHLAAQDIVVVGDPLGVSVLAQTWRPIDVSDRLFVHQIDTVVQADTNIIALADLGGAPRTLDVVDQAAWEANFDLGAASGNNRLPDEVVFDLAAAPSPQNGAPIASIYFNDVLIGAKLLVTNGLTQRVSAHIPRYALAARNTVRVVFQRQPDAVGCTARGRGYPVAVLPTSHLALQRADADEDFTGMNARYATHANLIVPHAYLNDALASVQRIARLVDAAGMSPIQARLSVVADGELAKPDGAFLAADVGLNDAHERATVSHDRLVLTDASGHGLIDLSGLSQVAVVDVVHSGAIPGIVFRTVGASAPLLPASLQLARGDIAVLDATGVVKQIDTLHQNGVFTDDSAPGSWREKLRWAIPAALFLIFVILLLIANAARRRHQKKP
jgi:hypothetical protein